LEDCGIGVLEDWRTGGWRTGALEAGGWRIPDPILP